MCITSPIIPIRILVLVGLCHCLPVWAVEPIAVLQPSGIPKGYGADFGSGLALSDDWMIIGASGDFAAGEPGSGSAYVYRREGINWIEHQILFGEGWYEERFGASIAIDGDWLMITGPNFSTFCCNTGRVYVFRRDVNGTKNELSDDSWELFEIINENLEQCCVGGPVALDNGVLVVGGARAEFDPDSESGRAFIYEWDGSTWAYKQTVRPFDPRPRDSFGATVAIQNTTIAIGAPYGLGSPTAGGAVYVFQRSHGGWVQAYKLFASDGGSDRFGNSICFGSDYLVIGAPSQGWQGGVGVAYIFTFDGRSWVEDDKLMPETTSHVVDGGLVVAADGKNVLFGADRPLTAFRFTDSQSQWKQVDHFNGGGETNPPRVAIRGSFALLREALYAVGDSNALVDFASVQNCFQHCEVRSNECAPYDYEKNGVIDRGDFPFFLLTFRGPGTPSAQ